MTKGRLQSILFIGDRERENSLFDSVLKVLQSYLSAAAYSFLLFDPYQSVQIQASAQCPLSIKSFKTAECPWPVVKTPHCTYLPMTITQVKAKSLPFHTKSLSTWKSFSDTAGPVGLLFATLHFLKLKEDLWKKSAQNQCFGHCCEKWHHQ